MIARSRCRWGLLLVFAGCLWGAAGCVRQKHERALQPGDVRSSGGGSAMAGQLFHRYQEERLRLYPLEATLAGDDRYNQLFPDTLSERYRSKLRRFYQAQLASVAVVERRSDLSEEDRTGCEILRWECGVQLEQLRFPTHRMPINQFDSLHLTIAQWASGTGPQPFRTVKDYEDWLQRLAAFSGWCGRLPSSLRQGIREGIVLPKALIRKVATQVSDLASGPVEEHLFYGPIRSMPASIASADRARLSKEYAVLLRERLIPAFRGLSVFLQGEYLEAGRESAGISALPWGREYYQLQIRAFTTTDMTAEQVFELGKKEVARILLEMEKVKKEVGFSGTLRAFFDHVRTRKELMPFKEPGEVLENFHAIHRTMKPSLERLFRRVPKTAFEIRRTEAFREKTASAEYIQGSIDGRRPGIFYVPIPEVREYNMYSDESLFLHEAIPGHHYQISLQQENTDLPAFRRTLWYNAYGEGWALYCESLGDELGLYRDPYQRFGMLSAEMHRAIRLVVDTGMHAMGWTREQAIRYSLEHEAESESSIVAEIERYMAWPGQALSYKVGQLKIRELRARAEQALGPKFDLPEFHERVLESGCLPLALLEAKIDRWIESVRRR